jgi:hypothetical protein
VFAGHGVPFLAGYGFIGMVLYKWEGKEDAKNDLKSSSSLPLHAQGRRRTVPFKTALFQCFVVVFF